MVKATLMRKQTVHLVVASLTFTAGLISNYVANGLSPRPASVSAVLEVCLPHSLGGCCEVHGGPLEPVRVQEICGMYEGSDGRGGRISVGRWCKSSALRQISPEDAPFLLRSGTISLFTWMGRNEEAREAQFPHGYGWEYEDCESGEEPCSTVHACDECRAAEVAWKRLLTKRYRP